MVGVGQTVGGWLWVVLGGRQTPAHYLPKEEPEMLHLQILYWLGQWYLSLTRSPNTTAPSS